MSHIEHLAFARDECNTLRFLKSVKASAVFALVVASLVVISPVQALDVCSLISRSEIGAAIGQPISSVNLDGPDQDTDTSSQTWTCTYDLTDGTLVVSVAEFASTSAAKKYITLENLLRELKEAEVQVIEDKGIGDRTFVLVDEESLGVAVLKGARYYALTADKDILPADRLKASLRKIAVMLLPKL